MESIRRLGSRLDSLLAVGIGGAVGAISRWALLDAVGPQNQVATTVAINIAGSVFMGVLIGRAKAGSHQRLLQGTGFAGGFTTFSSYALHIAEYLNDGKLAQAAVGGFGTPLLAVLGAGLGYRVGRML